jgi:glucose-1-phosphate adenylyltransferase
MARPRVLTLVMAGGAGNRLEVLTEQRAKPAMPYGGIYRLIDFPLSNCMNSGLSDVWIVQQYQPHSLNEHVSNGRPWDLDRTHGGLRLLAPHQGGEDSGWHQGNADAMWRNKNLITEFEPDLVVVLSSDHVYKLDYGEAISVHLEHDAEVTMVTTEVERDQASRLGTVEVDGPRVTGFEYKPESPSSDLVATEVFVFDAATLMDTLDDLSGNEDLEDIGDALLPRLVDRGRAFEHRLDGYWRDLGTVDGYWSANMDLLGEPEIRLDDPGWPIHTLNLSRAPAHVHASARLDDALISPGCDVRGRVERSILAPGVIVEEDAVVRDSILLHDAIVRSRATVDLAIVDVEVRVGTEATLGAPGLARSDASADDIAVVGSRVSVAPGARVGPGGRVEPGSAHP